MSKISSDGYEQIQIIKNALNSMFDKLDQTVYTKVKPTKNEDGMAYTMLGVYEEYIGDTVMVSCGYYEDNVQYLDSLGVIIDE